MLKIYSGFYGSLWVQDIEREQGSMAQEELLSGSDAHFGHKR